MIMRRNIVVGVTALAVVLSSGAIAFAATDTNYSQVEKSRPVMMSSLTEAQRDSVQQAHTDSLTEAIAALVDSDAITQEEADKLTEIRVVQKEKCKTDTLTDEQRTALQANLVDEGTITQEEADAISLMPAKIKVAGNGPESILTEDQRTALKEAVKTNLESKLADLVDDGTLTQELADQLLNNGGGLRMGPGGKHGNGFSGRPDTCVRSADTEDTSL